jgi:hypothetical protein
MLLHLAAQQGGTTGTPAQALEAGLQALGLPAGDRALPADAAPTVAELDRGLDVLRQLRTNDRRRLVTALAATILADEQLLPAEAALLRAVCSALECPLPPIEQRH